MDDAWDETDELTTAGICDHCGEERLVQLLEDPFSAEVNPDEPTETTAWCKLCWQARKDDI